MTIERCTLTVDCPSYFSTARHLCVGAFRPILEATSGTLPPFVCSCPKRVHSRYCLRRRPESCGARSSGVWARARPVRAGAVVFAEVRGTQLQDRFGTPIEPEFVGALHSAVDLLDGRFHRRATDRQSQTPVAWIVHAGAVVLHITQRVLQYPTRITIGGVWGCRSDLRCRPAQTGQ